MSCLHIFYKNDNEYEYEMDSFSYSYSLSMLTLSIHVPDHLKEKFGEMYPIFKNTEISRADIGDFMKSYTEEHNIMAQPPRSLIRSMKGEKNLVGHTFAEMVLRTRLGSDQSTPSG